MAYIGNSPANIQRGRRAIYEFTSTAGQTAYSGLDDNNQVLDLLEANEQSVFLNGIRLILNVSIRMQQRQGRGKHHQRPKNVVTELHRQSV